MRPIPTTLALVMLAAMPAFAGVSEKWQAVSKTAESITGDVTFSPDRITFQNGRYLPIEPAGTLAVTGDNGKKVDAALYNVTKPQDPVLLRKNTLCGAPVTYIAVWRPAPAYPGDVAPRSMAAYSGAQRPKGDAGLCGTFNYDAGAR